MSDDILLLELIAGAAVMLALLTILWALPLDDWRRRDRRKSVRSEL